MKKSQLVLMSGGGFSTESESYIDQFAINLCEKEGKKNLFFIPTASQDAEGYIEKFNSAFTNHYTYSLTEKDLTNHELIEKADLIYIGGGDPHYLMEVWRKTNFDKKIVECLRKGVVIVGISAGAMCWFEDMRSECLTSQGLGILKGSLCPHYDIEDEEKDDYDEWSIQHPDIRHYRLADKDNFHVVDERIVAKISTY